MDSEKVNLLYSILDDLSDGSKSFDDGYCEEVLKRLRLLYDGGYRHLYSQIYARLVKIDSDCNSDKDITFIAQNIQIIYEYCEKKCEDSEVNDRNFLLKVKKLYDHINLDCARIEYIKVIQDKNNAKILDLAKSIASSRNDLNILTNKLEEKIEDSANKFTEITDSKIDKLQKDYVAILGIFASVVITFVAGISLSNSTLSALKEAGDNFYTLVFLAILIAMFIFNSLRALFDFLLKITDRKNPFETVPLFTCDFNIIFVVMMVIDYICYICFGKK